MKKLDSTFNKEMFKLAINDFTKNISFAIDKIRVVETALNELFAFIITINEYNNITLLDCEHMTLFIYYVVNNQIEFNCFRIIKYMSLNINYHKNIVGFVEFYEKELNKIKLRQ